MNRTTGEQSPSGWHRLRATRMAVIALLLVVMVLPGITGGVAFWRARDLLKGQVEQGQQASAGALVDALSWTLEMAATSAANAAASPELQAAAESRNRAAIEEQLRALTNTVPLSRTLALVDGEGAAVAQWPHALATPLRAVAQGTSRRMFDGRSTGTDAVVAVRVPSARGTALVAEISLQDASPQLPSFRFGNSGTATLVGSDGEVLLAGDAQRRHQSLRAPEVRRLVATMQPGQLAYYSPLLQRRNIATFQPVPSWDFGVLVDIAEAEAFADLTGLGVMIVTVVLGLTAVGLVGIWVVGGRLASSERDLRQAHDTATRQASTDALTGLGNRRAFDEQLALAVERARAMDVPLAVTMLDLNRFKRLNDSRGHAAGDAALRAVANEIRGAIRSDDVAARVGGDEFALVHLDCTDEIAARVAARICEAVARLGLLCDSDSGIVLTVSTGSAQLAEAMTPAELVATADVSLYRAKEQTRLVNGEPGLWQLERSG